ncbi:hypothetical protein GCM10023259_011790 [Thermocatellispora tengchongensis]
MAGRAGTAGGGRRTGGARSTPLAVPARTGRIREQDEPVSPVADIRERDGTGSARTGTLG